jgi:hypothetical protein
MVVHTCNCSPKKVGLGGLRVQGQPGLHRNSVSKSKIKQNKNNKNPVYPIKICIIAMYQLKMKGWQSGSSGRVPV